MFGWWAAPYDYGGFRYEPMDYGVAFSAVRRGLIDAFPDKRMSFGLVSRPPCSRTLPFRSRPLRPL
jgi:hypothetical protein